MVISTCIGGILDSIELDKCKVFNDLYVLNFAILAKNIADNIVTDIVDTTDKELSYKDELVDFLWRPSLVVDFLLSSFGELHEGLLKFFVELEIIGPDGQSDLLLELLLLSLGVVGMAFTKI